MSSGSSAVVDSFTHLSKATLLRRVCRDVLAQLVRALLLALDVLVNFFLMIEVVCQTGMNVGQAERRETKHNFFGSRALLIVMHDRFETDACVGNSNRAVFRD